MQNTINILKQIFQKYNLEEKEFQAINHAITILNYYKDATISVSSYENGNHCCNCEGGWSACDGNGNIDGCKYYCERYKSYIRYTGGF